MMNRVDELQLQRLVDGRLNLAETQAVLRISRDQPECWKQIAMAYIEEGLWQRQLADDPLASSSASESNGMRLVEARFAKFGSAHSRMPVWASVAALLIVAPLAFLLGRISPAAIQTGPDSPAVKSTPAIVGDSPVADGSSQLAMNESTPSEVPVLAAPYSMTFGRGENARSTPLMTGSMARELNYQPSVRPISSETIDAYRQQGLELQPQLRYYLAQTSDGRRIIVPMDIVAIKNSGL